LQIEFIFFVGGAEMERATKRFFSVRSATYTVIASMVGTGILTNSGYIISDLKSYGMLLLFWLLGGVVAILGSFAMAEMATAYPQSGGDYNFVSIGFGRGFGAVYGWGMILVGYAAPVALVTYTVANYLTSSSQIGFWLNSLFGGVGEVLNSIFASILIALFTVAHCLGHSESGKVQAISTQFKLLIFIGIVIGALAGDCADFSNIYQHIGPSADQARLGGSFILVMFAYTGWNAAVYLAGEMEDPVREVPRSLIIGCSLVIVLYLTINVFYATALPIEDVIGASADQKGRIALLASERMFGAEAAQVIAILLSLGMLASVSAFMLTGPRILYAMALDGLGPKRLERLHQSRHLPTSAIITQGGLSIILLWSGTFEALLDFTGFGLGLLSLASVGVIFRLHQLNDYQPKFVRSFYPYGPLIFVAVNAWMLIDGAVSAPWSALYSVLSFAIFLPCYFIVQKFQTKS
jgi:basic amino acid/polyamine antiporter, APA family